MNSFALMIVKCNKGYVPAGHSRRMSSHVAVGLAHAFAEQQGYAPQGGYAHNGVDHAADGRRLPAEEVGHQVKAEQADKQPVDAADDAQQQGYAVQHD